MAGNVWEYVQDSDNSDCEQQPTCNDCVFIDPNQPRIMMRGGGFTDTPDRAHNSTRDSDPSQAIRMNAVRCVLNAE